VIGLAQGIIIESLSALEIAENVALAASVGWPDDETDWRSLHAGALVLGVREAENLIAQGALTKLEPGAGTIAKMIVAPSAQRRGIGAKILDGLLSAAEQRKVTTLGLVATPLGEPLYASRGFEVTGQVAVLMGEPKLDRTIKLVAIEDIESVIAFEKRAIGCSRAMMLRERFRDASASAIYLDAGGKISGFALANPKPKASHTVVGPVIAEDEATARELMRAICAAISGAIRLDVPASHSSFRAWLAELGLAEKALRQEMALGGPLPWQVPQRFALATQAWG
jgi:GNAT superfamily N-acetyltransferase